jgi:hypothetical protein
MDDDGDNNNDDEYNMEPLYLSLSTGDETWSLFKVK